MTHAMATEAFVKAIEKVGMLNFMKTSIFIRNAELAVDKNESLAA